MNLKRRFISSNVPKPRTQSLPSFDRKMPLFLEIGCGVGFHPLQFSKQNPKHQMIAIEQTTNKFSKFYKRYLNHQCPENLYPFHDNAVHFITHLIKKETIHKYFILYPNPNPKKSDQNKRWHAMPFMGKLLETMVPGGIIEFATNESFYAEECYEWMTNVWELEALEYKTIPHNFPPRTHFEKKYLKREQKCFNLTFKKPS
tara:strand:- start:2542 stop:3144 length:603 start_codon:yes stop_codon:yes gene_type:complete